VVQDKLHFLFSEETLDDQSLDDVERKFGPKSPTDNNLGSRLVILSSVLIPVVVFLDATDLTVLSQTNRI
jgi:hypothetical protein